MAGGQRIRVRIGAPDGQIALSPLIPPPLWQVRVSSIAALFYGVRAKRTTRWPNLRSPTQR